MLNIPFLYSTKVPLNEKVIKETNLPLDGYVQVSHVPQTEVDEFLHVLFTKVCLQTLAGKLLVVFESLKPVFWEEVVA